MKGQDGPWAGLPGALLVGPRRGGMGRVLGVSSARAGCAQERRLETPEGATAQPKGRPERAECHGRFFSSELRKQIPGTLGQEGPQVPGPAGLPRPRSPVLGRVPHGPWPSPWFSSAARVVVRLATPH